MTTPKASREGSSTRSSLNQQAYDEIRRQILNGELAPSTPLSEHQLAASLELSRTPVREAIKRLEKERLVYSVPNRGTFVAELAARDISEIYQVRERLESLAARIAAEQMSPDDIRTLEEEVAHANTLVAERRDREILESDIRFHKYILAATQNGRLIAVLATMDDQMYRVRVLFPRSPEWLDATLRDHAEIVERIKAHDGPGAEQAMERHLRSSRDYAMRLVLPVDVN
jgi:DNA-binding GntR family transcriptional regulator